MFNEENIRAWISASNLFMGTTEENGFGHVGAIELQNLPDLAALTTAKDLSELGHYYVWQGTPGYKILAGDLGGQLAGAVMQPGDWLAISNAGTAAAPDLKWQTISGDLLSKSRGDNLFGLKTFTDGNWESGSVVNYDGSLYRAQTAVVTGDPKPGEPASPWQKISLAGGVRWGTDDSKLAVTGAPDGEIWFIVNSSRAGGIGALYSYDKAKTVWEPLSGGGLALALEGGKVIYERPVPWGEVAPKPDGKYDGDLLFYPVSKNQVDRWDDLNQEWNPVLTNRFSNPEIFPPTGAITDKSWASAEGGDGWFESHIYCSVAGVRPSIGIQLKTPGVLFVNYYMVGEGLGGGAGYRIAALADRGGAGAPIDQVITDTGTGIGALDISYRPDNPGNRVQTNQVLFMHSRWHRVIDAGGKSELFIQTESWFHRVDGINMTHTMAHNSTITTFVEDINAGTKIRKLSHIPNQGTDPRTISVRRSH